MWWTQNSSNCFQFSVGRYQIQALTLALHTSKWSHSSVCLPFAVINQGTHTVFTQVYCSDERLAGHRQMLTSNSLDIKVTSRWGHHHVFVRNKSFTASVSWISPSGTNTQQSIQTSFQISPFFPNRRNPLYDPQWCCHYLHPISELTSPPRQSPSSLLLLNLTLPHYGWLQGTDSQKNAHGYTK